MGTQIHFGLMITMLVAGAGIPIMAALNSGLGQKLGSPLLAVTILSAVALIASIILLILTGGLKIPDLKGIPFWYLSAGLLFILYIFSITKSAPIIGLGTAVFLVLLGQIISAAIIDQFGLFGNPIEPISGTRVLGIIMIVAGIILTQFDAVTSSAKLEP